MGYVDYFLIVWDFIRFAKSQGIAVGPGRGSAAGSIVSYCLEITNIDPTRYQLMFERFQILILTSVMRDGRKLLIMFMKNTAKIR